MTTVIDRSPTRRILAILVSLIAALAVALVNGAPARPASAAEAGLPSYSFDVGPGAVAPGYTGISCTTAYDAAVGYGFTNLSGVSGRDRATSDPLRSDFCSGASLDLGVDLPVGAYTVRIISGDATATQTSETVSAEGRTMLSGITASAGTYAERSFSVKVSDGQLSLHVSGSPARLNAVVITPFVWEPGLRLTDNGDGTIHLQNSKVSLDVTTATATITDLRLAAYDPTRNLLGGGSGYYLANYTLGGKAYAGTLRNATFRVVQQDADRIEVAFTEDDPSVLPFEVEIHMALEADSPGLYYYTVYRYPDTMPAGLSIDQLRYAFRADAGIFRTFAVDDARQGTAPLQSALDAGTPVQDATFRLADGSVYTKYEQISDGEGANSVFSIMGDGVAMSLVQPNKDWSGGGPTRQELTTHTGGGPLLLWHENSRHFGGDPIVPGYGWAKVYGPFFLYLDTGDSSSVLWSDAKAQLATEVAKWPYRWITDPLYAATSRSDVTGRLQLSDGHSAEGAWVILADPGADWQQQTSSYVYSAQAAADGTFRIPAVRPGTYTLHAFVPGEPGELADPAVAVASGTAAELGTVMWHVENHGTMLWQIGTPDRTAGEFAVPEGDPSPVPGPAWRKFGTWLSYPVEFPNDTDFHVGVDNPATDWPYFQPMIKTPGNPAQLKVPYDASPTDRRIHFSYDGATVGSATLTIGIASSVYGSLAVAVNGTQVQAWPSIPGPAGDNALYRQSDRGKYRQLEEEFPLSLLHGGDNVIDLTPAVAPQAGDWTSVFASIMYDFIRMEVRTPATSGDKPVRAPHVGPRP